MQKFQCLIIDYRRQTRVWTFSFERIQIPTIPQTPNRKVKGDSPWGLPLNVATNYFPIGLKPFLHITLPKIHICFLNSQLNPHLFDSMTVSESMQYGFRFSLTNGTPFINHHSPFCKASLDTYAIVYTSP